mgnify:CR=1 FL=1
MHAHDTTTATHAVDASAPPSTLAALHQRELAVLAELERRQARLAERIAQQLRRVRAAERLLTGEGQQ